MGLCSLQVLAQDSVLQSMSLSHSLSRRHPSLEMQTFCPAPQPSPCSSGWPDLILGAEASSPLNAFPLSPPAHTLRPPPCSFLWLSRWITTCTCTISVPPYLIMHSLPASCNMLFSPCMTPAPISSMARTGLYRESSPSR